MTNLLVVIDNRLRFPTDCPEPMVKRLKEATTHPNPEHAKKRSMGHWTGDTPRNINTWRQDESGFSLPRGVTKVVRRIADEMGVRVRWLDRRVRAPVEWSPPVATARPYQVAGIDACVQAEQGIIRSPTGSGKTFMALASLPRLGERSLVVMRDRNLLGQWLDRAQSELGLRKRDVGVVKSGSRNVGECLTLCLQQSLYSKSFPLDEFARLFGAVIVDEVHDAAAKTVGETVDAFPARVRLGFSADHRRKDRKEFLVEDLFGPVIFEVDKDELESAGHVCPVIVRLVPTDFEADWYVNAPSEERDFTKLVSEIIADSDREIILRRVVLELVSSGCVPVLVFTRRREHAVQLAEHELPADGVPSGLLLGSAGNEVQFEEAKSLLLRGILKVAVGTFSAVGQGIDIPNVMAGVCATPIGGNKQFFGQVRGRICRPSAGKTVGYLYYLWDQRVFSSTASNLMQWNGGLVEVFDRGVGRWVPFSTRR